nr:hypothetical protein [Acidobacteriota bacterium]
MRPILVRLVPCLVLAALAAAPAVAAEPSIQALIEQLRNERCDYSSQAPEPCVVVEREGSWLQWLTSRFHAEYECPLGAARCLEALGPRARAAVPALIEVLREGPNDYDTGDGVIPTRSAIAAALGAIGDPRAIGPLAEALTKAVPADRADTATVSAEPAARQAIIEALGRFGPAAAAHAGAVAAVLRARNADRTYVERRRAAFEQQQAVKIAIEEIQAEQPDRSRFSVPPSRVAKAAKKIDRTTADYLRNFEQNARDPLASAAALALGAFGETSATPVLTDALRN